MSDDLIKRYGFDDNHIGTLRQSGSSLDDRIIKRPSGIFDVDWWAHAANVAHVLEAQAKRIEKLERELHASKIVAECRMDELLVGGEVLALRERIADLDAQVRNCAQTADRRLTRIEKLEAANRRLLGEVSRADERIKGLEDQLGKKLEATHLSLLSKVGRAEAKLAERDAALRKLLLIGDGAPHWDQEEWDAWDAAVEMAHSLTVEGLGK